MEKKQLKIGDNYGSIFGLTDDRKMIYNGGISWTAIDPIKGTKTMDSQLTTDNAIAYINQASYRVGV